MNYVQRADQMSDLMQFIEEEKKPPRNMTEVSNNNFLRPSPAEQRGAQAVGGPGMRQTSWGEDIELKSQFSVQEVKDE